MQRKDAWLNEQKKRMAIKYHPYYGLCNREPVRWAKICDRSLMVFMWMLLPLAISEMMALPVALSYALLFVAWMTVPVAGAVIIALAGFVFNMTVSAFDWLKGE